MPKPPQRKPRTNPPPPGKNGTSLADLIRHRVVGTDEVKIGGERNGEVITATMADAAKLVRGIKYLLRGYVPFGMLTGVISEPGKGKSAFVLHALVRPVITGCHWFTGRTGPSKPGKVLWCGTENDIAITLDRMQKWKMPKRRIILPFEDPLQTVNLGDEAHIERIEELVNHFQTKLFVVDSLRGGHGDDENNSRVGRVLQSLAGIAERTSAACVIVHHTSKLMQGEEITANSSRGSNAILAMMRSQIGIDQPDPDSPWCRARMLKENLGIAPKPFGFRVTNQGIEFAEPPEPPKRATQKDQAAKFLQQRMEPGTAYASSELLAEAEQRGFNKRTVQRAATEILRIHPEPKRDGKKINEWTWRLPGDS